MNANTACPLLLLQSLIRLDCLCLTTNIMYVIFFIRAYFTLLHSSPYHTTSANVYDNDNEDVDDDDDGDSRIKNQGWELFFHYISTFQYRFRARQQQSTPGYSFVCEQCFVKITRVNFFSNASSQQHEIFATSWQRVF